MNNYVLGAVPEDGASVLWSGALGRQIIIKQINKDISESDKWY